MDNTVAILSISGCIATGVAINQIRNRLKQIIAKKLHYESIKEFSPTTLLKYFNESKSTQVEAFVCGDLISEQPIVSRLPLIWSQKQYFDIYENNIKKLKKVIDQSTTQMSLADYYNKVDIWRNNNLNYQTSLTHIQDKIRLKMLGIFQRLINFFLKIFNQARSKKVIFRGFSIGELEREYGIIAGDFYVLYGEVILDKKLNKLFMQNPKYLLKNKRQLLMFLQQQIRVKKITIGILIIMFLILVYILQMNIQKMIFKFLKEREKRKFDKLRGIKYLQINNYECQICYEKPRNIILKPCKHLSICDECLQRLKLPKCPICKSKIEDQIQVFFS